MLIGITIRFFDIIDILLVAVLLLELYRLIKGTAAMKIFISVVAFYLLWKIVKALNMELLSEILGQFINVGVLAIIIVFQKEIRQFLLMFGTSKIFKDNKGFFLFWKKRVKVIGLSDFRPVILACQRLSNSGTGALIVIIKSNPLKEYIETGEIMEARISNNLIENIFFKNSPLHDGALMIHNNKIVAARCILPSTERTDIPENLGLRHRAAIGITELSDAIAIVVSEQTSEISYCKNGILSAKATHFELRKFLEREFNN